MVKILNNIIVRQEKSLVLKEKQGFFMPCFTPDQSLESKWDIDFFTELC